jgi:hypothetical protein
MWSTSSDVSTSGASITVNGSTSPLTVGDGFAAAIKAAAVRAGLGKFRVFVNGDEVRPSEAPATVESGMSVTLRPYDVAA